MTSSRPTAHEPSPLTARLGLRAGSRRSIARTVIGLPDRHDIEPAIENEVA